MKINQPVTLLHKSVVQHCDEMTCVDNRQRMGWTRTSWWIMCKAWSGRMNRCLWNSQLMTE